MKTVKSKTKDLVSNENSLPDLQIAVFLLCSDKLKSRDWKQGHPFSSDKGMHLIVKVSAS